MPGELAEAKRRLRAALAQRPKLSKLERSRRSAALTQRLVHSESWRNASSVAAFVGIGHEPDTAPLLRAAIAQGKSLWLPRVVGDELRWAQVDNLDTLVAGRFGLIEPTLDITQPGPPPVSLVLVPGLAFAPGGARIGWGRGYYDRMLAALPAREAPRIGLCFDDRYDPPQGEVPMGPHDARIESVVTDLSRYRNLGDSARGQGQ